MIPECNGRSYYITEKEGIVIQCRHIRNRTIRDRFLNDQYLGQEMVDVEGVRGTLLDVGIDRTTENLFFRKCPWGTFLAHLKFVVHAKMTREKDWTFRVITDEEIKRVFVGAESYTSRKKEERDLKVTFNSLADLVREYDLVIVRLGQLGYKNRAAPGAFRETLLHREAVREATWIVEPPGDEFQNMQSYDFEVGEFIDKRFEDIELGDLEIESKHDVEPVGDETDGMGAAPEEEVNLVEEDPYEPDHHTKEPTQLDGEQRVDDDWEEDGFLGNNEKKGRW